MQGFSPVSCAEEPPGKSVPRCHPGWPGAEKFCIAKFVSALEAAVGGRRQEEGDNKQVF